MQGAQAGQVFEFMRERDSHVRDATRRHYDYQFYSSEIDQNDLSQGYLQEF